MEPPFLAVDLDNTLVSYGALFLKLAREEGVAPPGALPCKTAVRDALRALPGGEARWRRLQAAAYGPRMHEAALEPLAARCLKELAAGGARLAVVSHKTRFAHPPHEGVNLHDAAMGFLKGVGLLTPLGPLGPDMVFLEQTRELKVARIRCLRPGFFLDDLPEVLAHEDFPSTVARLLYDPSGVLPLPEGADRATSWRDVWRLVTGCEPGF